MERKLDLNNYGLVEMNKGEMQEVVGGMPSWLKTALKIAAAVVVILVSGKG